MKNREEFEKVQQEGGEGLDMMGDPTLLLLLRSDWPTGWFTCHMTSANNTVSPSQMKNLEAPTLISP